MSVPARSVPPPALVLTDIEGTTTPIAFVHDTLFGFARAHLPRMLATRADEPEIADALARVRQLAPGREPLEALLGWMEQDAKIEPLKTLQGIAWRDGYARGALQGRLHADVAPALHAWRGAGIRLAVYSSGSETAQRLIFGHTAEGDLSGLFEAFFDTRVGAKREPDSYRTIAGRLDLAPAAILFLSDVGDELDAARAAGLETCQLVRAANGTVASGRHPVAPSFEAVASAFGLPA